MSLTELRALAPPPSAAPSAMDLDWAAVQERLGTDLPADYKALAQEYGAGTFDDFLWVFSPITPNPYMNLLEQAERQLDALRAIREASGDAEVPYAITDMRRSALLPWGITDNGDVCFWHRRSADPETWTVAVHESRGPDWFTYDTGGLTDFLLALLTRRVKCYIFPEDFPNKTHSFRPARNSG